MARAEFEVEDLGNGTFDVRQQGRVLGYDQDLDEAVRLVVRRGGTEYVLIEPDGYRTTHKVR